MADFRMFSKDFFYFLLTLLISLCFCSKTKLGTFLRKTHTAAPTILRLSWRFSQPLVKKMDPPPLFFPHHLVFVKIKLNNEVRQKKHARCQCGGVSPPSGRARSHPEAELRFLMENRVPCVELLCVASVLWTNVFFTSHRLKQNKSTHGFCFLCFVMW